MRLHFHIRPSLRLTSACFPMLLFPLPNATGPPDLILCTSRQTGLCCPATILLHTEARHRIRPLSLSLSAPGERPEVFIHRVKSIQGVKGSAAVGKGGLAKNKIQRGYIWRCREHPESVALRIHKGLERLLVPCSESALY